MEKEIAIGNTVERLQEQYSCFNPSKFLSTLSLNQRGEDSNIISKINSVDKKLSYQITTLCKDLLLLRKGNVVLDIQNLLSLLNSDYNTLINSLQTEETEFAKVLFNEWKLEWMFRYIKDATLLEDETFFEKYRLDIDEEIENKVKDMRLQYFTEEELMEIFGDEYFVEC